MLFSYLTGVALVGLVSAQTTLEVSHDGNCGNDVTCRGSMFGGCCSASGKCGSYVTLWTLHDVILILIAHWTTADLVASSSLATAKGQSGSLRQMDPAEVTQGSLAKTADLAIAAANIIGVVLQKIIAALATQCGAEFRLECDLDRINGDLQWLGNGFYTDTLEECAAACAQWPKCKGVNWVDYHTTGPCYLKTSNTKARANKGVHAAVMLKDCTKSGPSTTPALDKPPFGKPTSTKSIEPAKPTNLTKPTKLSSRPYTTASGFTIISINSAITTITPMPSAADSGYNATTAISSSRAIPSASTCSSSFARRKKEGEEECTPCDGQSGSLPYCGADATTDNYKFTPKTCRTVYYEFDITNGTVAPDGIERIAFLVNGQMPGPTIEANWGDTVVVKVNNKLTVNGTSVHFHGIRQWNTVEYDGVPSITQCPIAPGDSFTYKFIATNFGTSWYHSHYAIQAWMGVFGPMVIHGPTSKDYDVDAGTIFLNDWTHNTVDSLYDLAQDSVNGGPRIMDNASVAN
ncbi:multicopper oxidase [Paraphaeosphaeria sporulosa]